MCAALKESCKPLLKSQKNYTKKGNEEVIDDISKVIQVDT